MGVTRRLVLAAAIAACGGKSDEPPPAGSATAPAPSAGITLPVVSAPGEPVVRYFALSIASDGLHAVGPITLADPDSGHPQLVVAGQPLAVDDHGRLVRVLPAGDAVSVRQLADKLDAAGTQPQHTLVFAEATAKVVSLDPVAAAGHNCTNIAVAIAGQLSPLPVCFPKAMTGDVERVDLVLVVTPGETLVMTTQISNLEHATDTAQLAKILSLRKASKYFADRNDAKIIVKPDTTIGDLATALAELRKAGFVDVRLEAEPPQPISPKQSGEGSTNAPPPPSTIVVTVDCTRVDGAQIEIGQRIIRARVGVFRACFQKELAHGAHDGNADVSFGVKDGKPTAVTVAGSVPSTAVSECVKANIARLSFPTPITAVRCAFTFKH